MDPLSLSKMSSGEQLDKIADAIENTEIDESTLETAEEVTSTKATSISAEDFPAPETAEEVTSTKATGVSAEDFPAPETAEENAEELATVVKSTADKT